MLDLSDKMVKGTCHRNLGAEGWREHEEQDAARGEARASVISGAKIQGDELVVKFTSNGTLVIDTGKYTGRSPRDKYVVHHGAAVPEVWWGEVNQAISPELAAELRRRVFGHLEGRKLFVQDGFAGASAAHRLAVRTVACKAWQAHFMHNMLIRPDEDELASFIPELKIYNAAGLVLDDWEELGLRSPTFIVLDLESMELLIGGTWYTGEMKKGVFTVMNWLLPRRGVLSMHCSANVGKDGASALFFGLSGTGKTTLSADPERLLIGDDEHGWDENGIFNIEGGCYAKCINLDSVKEPDIFRAIRPGAILENVVLKKGEPDYADGSRTENTRVSYPIEHIPNIVRPHSLGGHPKHIIFLTCDAFGVLPPVSRLEEIHVRQYFLSGYTAKVAGTERGVTEPQATFSPCFGGPFLPLPPTRYADLLIEKIKKHGAKVWLVNTGWSGGPCGVGQRMPIPLTRRLVSAILSGEMERVEFVESAALHLQIPVALPGVESRVLEPRNTWSDASAYDAAAAHLAKMFTANALATQSGCFGVSGGG
ncbi:MAG: Phosphoenolpyruvate carboxykinase [Verrucomicrobiota bacterium]|jgi:phosphoenolpyruvate carboxykinase (ATP)